MNAYVGCNSSRLGNIAFPRGVIPQSSGGYVSQIDVVYLVFRSFIDHLLPFDDCRVQTELENVIDFFAGLLFHLLQGVYVPRIKHKGFFAYHIGSCSQSETNVRVVKVVWSADTDKVQSVFGVLNLLYKAVKSLILGIERALRKIAVHYSDRITLV